MGRSATSLVFVGALGLIAAFAGASGCSASGSTEDVFVPDSGLSTDGSPGGSKLPPPSGTSSSTSSTGGTNPGGDDDDQGGPTDGGHTDSGSDAGPPQPPAPKENDPCTTLDMTFVAACGFCGTQKAICEKKADGSLGWSGYGPCDGVHGECAAGATKQEACNNCGMRTITCSSACKWGTGTCSAAANVGCVPLSYDVTNAGCGADQTGLFRLRQCPANCSFTNPVVNYSQTCQPAPTTIEVGPSVGSISTTVATLGGSLAKISTSSCPVTTISSTSTAYAYTQIHNPLATDVNVVVYNSIAQAPGTVFKTVLVAYAGDTAPSTVDDRKNCVKASNSGTASLTGDSTNSFASIDPSKHIPIPAGGTITVYIGAGTATDSGPVRISVKTDTFGPP